MTDTIAALDAEISRLQQQASAVARAPKSFDEVWPAAEAEMLEAKATFERLGPQLSGFISQLPEHVHQRRQADFGACMVANGKAVLDSERARIKANTANGIASADKARRGDELRRQIERAAAKREIARRAITGGDFRLLPVVHPQTVILPQATLEQLAR